METATHIKTLDKYFVVNVRGNTIRNNMNPILLLPSRGKPLGRLQILTLLRLVELKKGDTPLPINTLVNICIHITNVINLKFNKFYKTMAFRWEIHSSEY